MGILAELYAQALEANGIKVERKINLGGTLIAHKALEERQIDLYPEYTGTMLLAVIATSALTILLFLHILGAIAVLIAAINIAGGFLVTNRMLGMFRKYWI